MAQLTGGPPDKDHFLLPPSQAVPKAGGGAGNIATIRQAVSP
jgi:hypothetical protein